MTDKELLELAAKAAEYHVACWPCRERGFRFGFIHAKDGGSWDPLNDDGDALRLAVKLDLLDDVTNYIEIGIANGYFPDVLTATRRAIVHAAAEIGKGME